MFRNRPFHNSRIKQERRRFATKKDIFIICGMLLVALALLLGRDLFSRSANGSEAEIYYNSKKVRTIALRPDLKEKFSVSKCVIQVEGSQIRFLSSPCPQKICVKAGFLSLPGESAACLPHKVAIRIVADGGESGQADTYIS